jgi:hypothetical protein
MPPSRIAAFLLPLALACAPAARTPSPAPEAPAAEAPPPAQPPAPPTCPDGEVVVTECVDCGPTDGCLRTEPRCRPTCDARTPCADGDCIRGACVTLMCG